MKKYGLVLMALLLVGLFISGARADTTDKYNDGSWKIDATGNMLTVATSNSITIGDATHYPAQIFLGGTGKSSWGSVVSPWEDTGTTTVLTSQPTYFILTHSTGNLFASGVTIGYAGETFVNGLTITENTDNALVFTENSDTLTMKFDGSSIEFEIPAGTGPLLIDNNHATASEATINFAVGNDDDDYMRISTLSNVPQIDTVGDCNLTIAPAGGTVAITGTLTASTAVSAATIQSNGGITLQNGEVLGNANTDVVTVTSNGTDATLKIISAGDAANAYLYLVADKDDDAADDWVLKSKAADNALEIINGVTVVASMTSIGALTSADLTVIGTTPLLTIGDAGAEDNAIVFDNTSMPDFYIGSDYSNTVLAIGTGSTVGTNQIFAVTGPSVVIIGDGDTQDNALRFDSSSGPDLYIGSDYSTGALSIGTGATVGTNQILSVSGPSIVTIGDNDDQDNVLQFNQSNDYYIAGDDSTGKLIIGTGTTVASNVILSVSGPSVITIGDADTQDNTIVFDGDDNDFYFAQDTSANSLIIGSGTTVATNPILTFDNALNATFSDDVTIQGVLTATCERVIPFLPTQFITTDGTIISAQGTTTPCYDATGGQVGIVWEDNITSATQIKFRVPANYSSGGGLRGIFSTQAIQDASPPYVDFQVFSQAMGAAWDTSATNQAAQQLTVGHGASPELVTFTVATDFAGIQAASMITVDVWRDNVNTMTSQLEMYYLEFYYTAKQ